MRRSDKEIKDRGSIDAIIRSCKVCRLALSDGCQPYVVPLCFGYDSSHVYFHGAPEGRKIELIRRNPRVCVEFEIVDGIVEGEQACHWGMKYRSVIGFGTAEIIEDPDSKKAALAWMMRQYCERNDPLPEEAVRNTCVIRVRIEQITGKRAL